MTAGWRPLQGSGFMYLLQEGLHTESFLDPCWLSPIALVDGSLPAPCRGQSLICWLPEEEARTVPPTSPPPTASGRGGQQGVVREGPVLAPCSWVHGSPGQEPVLVFHRAGCVIMPWALCKRWFLRAPTGEEQGTCGGCGHAPSILC